MNTRNERQRRCLKAIEDLLGYVRRDDSVKEDVRWLEERYQSADGILEGCREALADGHVSAAEAQLLGFIPELARYAMHEEHGAHPRLNTFGTAAAYLKPLFIGVNIEQVWLLCLDESGRLIESHLIQKGALDETPFYLGRLLQNVVESNAAAVVLSHNHPGGTLRPSSADIESTLYALRAMVALRVILLDHIIIAGKSAVSMRACSEISPLLWQDQNRESALLKNWLDDFDFDI